MNILIRTDSSSAIGSGHLTRCLTLAEGLRQGGIDVVFVCRDLPGNISSLVPQKDFDLHLLPSESADQIDDAEQTLAACRDISPIDWLIVDHYGLDITWQNRIRGRVEKIMVIDDLADRRHDCDLLLDQNLYENLETRYDHLVPDHCRLLLGPRYVLLRDRFRETRKIMTPREGELRRLLVFFGGSDPAGLTVTALKALPTPALSDTLLDIVIGAANGRRELIRNICEPHSNWRLHIQTDKMADLTARADLALGAAGSATWERCCLGLPTLFAATSNNEIELARACTRLDIGRYLGRHEQITPAEINRVFQRIRRRPQLIRRWSKKAASLVDGLGAKRVHQVITEYARVEVKL